MNALGQRGEDAAAAFLTAQGMTILARNFRVREGEIDIVARDDAYIVFVEVKARTSCRFGTPAEAVDARKRKRLCRAALAYLAQTGQTDAYCRFDVIEWEQNEIRHLRNAFDASSFAG